ncbi:S-adenosyl-L-methionine-dependent methyltransferase [Viridothelium virens]|uniref:S-adenosyl-L-methionine-dependent methyltransferase n=1 Tax=Viridothelium virens TaxID=1048519 RepID=A0A6A6H4T1_VIRVR|nr:S-adenosyl-L-methionine-dependent methyltransferase [Viridothelium virens]
MTVATPLNLSQDVFARGKAFWNNYLKGRPSAPDVFFERFFRYHEEHGGRFDIVHDVGAGNGPYAAILRSKFRHVIISDVVSDNVALARERLGTDGFSYRTARVEDAGDIPNSSVDMVFATNVMHFCEQELAMEAIAKQLRPGGTFTCAVFGAACFDDPRLQDTYTRIGHVGARALLQQVNDPERMIVAMARTQGPYNVAPLDETLFLPGAQRINLNMPDGGIISPLPPEMRIDEPIHTGLNDIEVFEREEGWSFVTDLNGVREHIASFPFGRDFGVFADLWQEVEKLVGNEKVKGSWPAKIILATRK